MPGPLTGIKVDKNLRDSGFRSGAAGGVGSEAFDDGALEHGGALVSVERHGGSTLKETYVQVAGGFTGSTREILVGAGFAGEESSRTSRLARGAVLEWFSSRAHVHIGLRTLCEVVCDMECVSDLSTRCRCRRSVSICRSCHGLACGLVDGQSQGRRSCSAPGLAGCGGGSPYPVSLLAQRAVLGALGFAAAAWLPASSVGLDLWL